MITSLAALVASFSFITAMIWAGLMDLTTMKIRNELILFLLAIYAAFSPLTGFTLSEIGLSAAMAFSVLACMFVLFGLGWIGGGDAKLAAVTALWLGADHIVAYLVYTALFGGGLALAILQFRSVPLPIQCLKIGWIARLHGSTVGVPYGVAMAMAALFVFPDTAWMTAFSRLTLF